MDFFKPAQEWRIASEVYDVVWLQSKTGILDVHQTSSNPDCCCVSCCFCLVCGPLLPSSSSGPPVSTGGPRHRVRLRLLGRPLALLGRPEAQRGAAPTTFSPSNPPSPEGKDGGAMEWSECFSGAFSGLNRWTREKSWISLHWM